MQRDSALRRADAGRPAGSMCRAAIVCNRRCARSWYRYEPTTKGRTMPSMTRVRRRHAFAMPFELALTIAVVVASPE